MTCLSDLPQFVYQIIDEDIGCSAYSPESGYSEGSMSPHNNITPVNNVDPCIEIIEQPQNSFRFRYLKESTKPHGPLRGAQSARSKQDKSGPKVKLHNFNGNAIIRCWLSLPNSKEPHVHQLVGQSEDGGIKYEPHDIKINSANNYTASFDKLNIIHVVLNKEEYCKSYYQKKVQMASGYEKPDNPHLAYHMDSIKKEMKGIEKNLAALYFEVFVEYDGFYIKVCEAVSDPIKNKKNPKTSDLKITRQSSLKGSCLGGQEVFIFVEKVVKGIKIRFFEEDSNTEEEIWSDDAIFGPLDIHHQVAIAFRTPRYRNVNITQEVKVNFQLVRESDDSVSPPVPYYYQPDPESLYGFPEYNSKKRKICSTDLSVDNILENLLPSQVSEQQEDNNQLLIPIPADDFNMTEIFNMDQYSSFNGDLKQSNEIIPNQVLESSLPATLDQNFSNYLFSDIVHDGIMTLENEQPTSTDNLNQNINELIENNEESRMNKILHQSILERNDILFEGVLSDIIHLNKDKVLNTKNKLNKTPLQMAVHIENPKYVKRLIEGGSNIDIVDSDYNNALHIAAAYSPKCLKVLLNYYSDSYQEECNSEGDNLLLLAARENCSDSLTILMDCHWDPNFKNLKTGDTALHIATKYGHENLVKMLLKYGSYANLQNNSGYTPFHYAASTGMINLLELLFSVDIQSEEDGEIDQNKYVLKGPSIHEIAINEEVEKYLSTKLIDNEFKDPKGSAKINKDISDIPKFLDENKDISCEIAQKMNIGFLVPVINSSNKPSQILLNYLEKNNESSDPMEIINKYLSELCLNKS